MGKEEKLIRVTLEFETYSQTLIGEDAQRWIKAINGPIILQQLRGYNNKELGEINEKWLKIPKEL